MANATTAVQTPGNISLAEKLRQAVAQGHVDLATQLVDSGIISAPDKVFNDSFPLSISFHLSSRETSQKGHTDKSLYLSK